MTARDRLQAIVDELRNEPAYLAYCADTEAMIPPGPEWAAQIRPEYSENTDRSMRAVIWLFSREVDRDGTERERALAEQARRAFDEVNPDNRWVDLIHLGPEYDFVI